MDEINGWSIEEVARATGGTILRDSGRRFSTVCTDTRKIVPGALFVALKGERFDGHAFIADAARAGAAGVIAMCDVQGEEIGDASAICVNDTLAAYQALANLHRKKFDIPVVAITGSNGKTTTKDLVAAVLGVGHKILKTQANFNNEIGLPLTLLGLDETHEAAVVEMGMRGFGEIRTLATVALPTVGIVTNVGETHIELLGSLENIARAKGELVEAIGADGIVVLNAGNGYVAAMREKAKGKVVTFGLHTGDVRAEKIETSENARTRFVCVWNSGRFEFCLPLVGNHNVENALAAIAVALEFGRTSEEIQEGFNEFVATAMRQDIQKTERYTILNDAYNASPASMAAAIAALAQIAAGRKVAVLGDMLELGEFSAAAHTRVGECLAQNGIDLLVTVGEMAALIARAAEDGGVGVAAVCKTHAEAGEALRRYLKPGDTILFKGSRGMKMETIIALI